MPYGHSWKSCDPATVIPALQGQQARYARRPYDLGADRKDVHTKMIS